MLPTEAELESRACALFDLWGVLDRLAHVEVSWNARLRTSAGRARPRTLQIHLNPRLLARVPDRIDEVLTHEAAHLAATLLHGPGTRPHGPEWRRLMERAGYSPTATHDFPLDGLGRRGSYVLHLCEECGARQIQASTRAPEPAACGCGPERRSMFRAPRTPAGFAALERFREAADA